MDAPRGGRAPGSPDGADGDTSNDTDGAGHAADADLVVGVLHRIGRCPLQTLTTQPELSEWSSGRLEQAVVRAWNGGLVFIDRNDDLVAL